MENKILKGSVIAFVIMLCLIVIASGVSAQTSPEEDTNIQTLSKGGLSISYPSDWGSSEATSNYSIMAISKKDSIDSSGVGQVNINFEKKPLTGEFTKFVNDTYKQMQYDSSFTLVSSGESVVAGKNALEYVYTSNEDGAQKEHKAVWFEKGGQAYALLYSAPLDQFDANLYVFNYILTDIQIT